MQKVPSLLPEKPRMLDDAELKNIATLLTHHLQRGGFALVTDNLLAPGFHYGYEYRDTIRPELAGLPIMIGVENLDTGAQMTVVVQGALSGDDNDDEFEPRSLGKNNFFYQRYPLLIKEREEVESMLQAIGPVLYTAAAIARQNKRRAVEGNESIARYPNLERVAQREKQDERQKEQMGRMIMGMRMRLIGMGAVCGLALSTTDLPERACDAVIEEIILMGMQDRANGIEKKPQASITTGEYVYHAVTEIKAAIQESKKDKAAHMFLGLGGGALLGAAAGGWLGRRKAEAAVSKMRLADTQ